MSDRERCECRIDGGSTLPPWQCPGWAHSARYTDQWPDVYELARAEADFLIIARMVRERPHGVTKRLTS